VGGGGGASVLAADDLDAAGLALPPILPETQEQLAKVTHEAGTSIRNPIDTTSLWDENSFEGTFRPIMAASNTDVILHHTSFGGGGGGSRGGDPRVRLPRQADTLGRLQEEFGKPVVVAIRPATTTEGFEQSATFQELCWQQGLATFPSIVRAGQALANLVEWQRRQA